MTNTVLFKQPQFTALKKYLVLYKIALICFVFFIQLSISFGQTLTTRLDISSLKVCRDTARLTVKLVNNTGSSISDGRFVVDLGTLVFSTFVGKTGSSTSPNINYISGVRDTFKLDGILNDMDSVEFVLSIRTNAIHLSGGPYTISTSFDHGGGSVAPVTNLVTVLRPSSPQLQMTYSGPTSISRCNTPVMFCDTIRNVSGSGFDVQNIRASLFFPSGTIISGVTIIPATITYNSVTQALSPFSLNDGQAVVICYTKKIDCSVTGTTKDSISILHNPVCPGTDVLVTSTSPSVAVNSASLSISGAPSGTTNVNRGDTLMYTMTINNAGPGATDSARHCVQGAPNIQLIGVEVSGTPLTPSSSSPVGFTCFNLPTLGSGANVMITEKWRVIGCDLPTINTISRLSNFGCNSMTCGTTLTTSNEVNVLIPTNSMRIDTRTPSLLSRCGAVDTVHVTIRNTGGPHDTLKNVISRLNLPAGFVQIGVSGMGVIYTGINDSISIPNILPQDSAKFYILVRATCTVASGSYSFSFFAKIQHNHVFKIMLTKSTPALFLFSRPIYPLQLRLLLL
ncbi:MAG: hypothetical protein IPK35_04775 [Saprospiraceae bacterium]|nr:hypothetical protein [Saprospiraceae bacterium]